MADEEQKSEHIVATIADFGELLKENPTLCGPLSNVVQRRMLSEKDAKIAALEAALKTKDCFDDPNDSCYCSGRL